MAEIWEFFFSTDPSRMIGTVLNYTILAIGIASIVELTRSVVTLRFLQRGLDGTMQQVKQQHTATPEWIGQVAASGSPKAHLSRRIRMLQKLHEHGADIDGAAFAASAVSELDREARLTRWAAANVVLLGLAGTLVGLSQGVLSALPFLRDVVSAPEATQFIVGAFEGLNTAFSTTLMGIFWAVVLTSGLGGFRSRQQQYLQLLEESFHVYIYPRFRTSPALAMVEAAKTLSALEKAIAKELTELVGQVRMQGMALTKTVEDSVGGMVREVSTTANALRESTVESLSNVVHETRERGLALTTTVDRSLSTLLDEVREGNAANLVQVTAVAEAIHRLVGTPGTDAKSLAAVLAQLEQGVQAMHRSSEHMVQLVPLLEETIARQADRQARDLHEAMSAYTGRLGESLNRQDALIETGFDRLEQGVGGFGDMLLSQLQAHDSELLDGVGRKLEPVGALLGQQVGHLAEMQRIAQGLASAASGLDRRSDDIGRAMGEVQHRAGALTHQLEQLGTSMDALARALTRTAGSPAQVTGLLEARPYIPPVPTTPSPVRSSPTNEVAPAPSDPKPPAPPARPGDAREVVPTTQGATRTPTSPPPLSPPPGATPKPPASSAPVALPGSAGPPKPKGNFWSRLFGRK